MKLIKGAKAVAVVGFPNPGFTLHSPLLHSNKVPEWESGFEPEKLCIDDMLDVYCGEFGSWQLRHFVLTSLAWALEALHTMVMIFADREPDWRCVKRLGSGCGENVTSVCGLEPGSWEWEGGSESSTVTQWGLVCGQKYKVGLVQALFFAGCTIGNLFTSIIVLLRFLGAGVFGRLSDSDLGRKGALKAVCILNAIFGCLTSLAPDYFTYLLLRFLTGFSTGGVGLCSFVLATEPVGPTKRGAAGMFTFCFFSTGIALLAGIAYVFPTWRDLYVASSVPSILYLLLVIPFISESPRWYLVRGEMNEAMIIMHAIAKSNGNNLPEGVILALDDEVIDASNENQSCSPEETGSTGDVSRSPAIRIQLFLSVAINFTCSVVYYGISLNVVNLETNLHLSVLLNAVAEMLAFTITTVLLDRFGRKPLAIGTQWFSAIFCLMGCFVGNVGIWKVIKLCCGALGIFGMAGTYNMLFIYTAELFPTVVRNTALGSATQAAQMGAILAPLVVVLGRLLPFLVFGLCGLVGGLFAFYLPETLNKPTGGIEEERADWRIT